VVTQPSVSAAVSALSRELGVELTQRVGRSIQPSPAGEAFAPFAADVIGLLDQGGRAAREAAEITSSELRLAAVTTAGEHIVPPLIEAFSTLHPQITLNLDVGNRARVFERVRLHRSDVAIGGRPPGEGVVGERFLDNPLVVITKPGDPLARRRSVPIEELAERPWLLREEGSGTRTMTEEILAANGLDPPVLTLGSNGAIKQGARAGLGVSIQSRLTTQLELDSGLLTTIDVSPPLPPRHWYLLRPEHGPVRRPVQEFLAFVRSAEGRKAIENAQRS
jgi:LysR family transcriptional regulator, low CO2-responsive transcriptional regulator